MIKKIIKTIKSPKKILIFLSSKGIIKYNDKKYLEFVFKEKTGKSLDLENPKTFNEKLQWLKLFNRNPEYTKMVDKYEAKKYVGRIIGEDYIIPTLGKWDDPNDIDFDLLPNEFVLKCNHNSGKGMIICKDKSKLDIKKTRRVLKKGLKQQYYFFAREWPYKNVKKCIIAEKFMTDSNSECLIDYKFFCFNGVPKIMYVSNDLSENTYTDFFDMDFKRINMRMKDSNSPEDVIIKKPKNFEEMKKFAAKLSKGIPFLRVDFYEIDNHIYFGELTFFHNAGFSTIKPFDMELEMGNWIDLDTVKGD